MEGYGVYYVIALAVVLAVLMRSLFTSVSVRERAAGDDPVAGPLAESAIHDAPAAAVVLDRNAVVRAWNKAAERMFGWSQREALNRPTPVPAMGAMEHDAHARALLGETVSGVKSSRMTKDGRGIEIDL